LQKIVQPVKIEKWAVVNFSARCDVRGLVRDLIKCGGMKGIVSSFTYLLTSIELWIANWHSVFFFAFCSMLNSLLIVLKKMASLGVHHLWSVLKKCLNTFSPNFPVLLSFSFVCFLRGRTRIFMVRSLIYIHAIYFFVIH